MAFCYNCEKQLNDGSKFCSKCGVKQEVNDNTSVNMNKVDPYEEIKKLKTLLDEGIITEEEFNKKKKELLGL